MTTPNAVSFMDSKINTLYETELGRLAETTRAACDALFAAIPSKPFLLFVNPPTHQLIYNVVLPAGRIQKLIVAANKKRGETRAEWEFRRDRVSHLRTVLGNVSLPTVESAAVRNSLEHFDERLDDINRHLIAWRAASPGERTVLTGIGLIVWDTVAAPESTPDLPLVRLAGGPPNSLPFVPIRLYAARSRLLMHWDDVLNLQALRDECAAISNALSPRFSVDPNATDPLVVA